MGYGERVDVADFSLVTANAAMMPPVWSALVAVDLLNMLRFYHLAAERTRGDADALFARFSDDLERLMLRERPDWRTRAAVQEAFRSVGEVQALLDEAAAAFRRPADGPRPRGRPARRLPLRRPLPARRRVGQRRPAAAPRRPRAARALRAVRRVLRAPHPARHPGRRPPRRRRRSSGAPRSRRCRRSSTGSSTPCAPCTRGSCGTTSARSTPRGAACSAPTRSANRSPWSAAPC